MNRRIRTRVGGFTLLEILLSIAIFALGGVAILALFLANANRARRAADANRAVEIAATVRETITAALMAPPKVVPAGDSSRYLYPIAFPFASLVSQSTRSGPNQSRDGASPLDATRFEQDPVPTYFLELPRDPYRGEKDRAVRGQTFMFLPGDLRSVTGGTATIQEQGAGPGELASNARVFWWKPDTMALAGERGLGTKLDWDDSDVYAFNLRIDRSISRADFADPRGGNAKMLLPGLYVVRLRVYRGFDPTKSGDENKPFEEFQFTVSALE